MPGGSGAVLADLQSERLELPTKSVEKPVCSCCAPVGDKRLELERRTLDLAGAGENFNTPMADEQLDDWLVEVLSP